MRTLKYAILGLISRMPMTGYDITGEFNNNQLANFWYAKHSQVYPELGRLVDEGLLTCQVHPGGEDGEKAVYHHGRRTPGAAGVAASGGPAASYPQGCVPAADVFLRLYEP